MIAWGSECSFVFPAPAASSTALSRLVSGTSDSPIQKHAVRSVHHIVIAKDPSSKVLTNQLSIL